MFEYNPNIYNLLYFYIQILYDTDIIQLWYNYCIFYTIIYKYNIFYTLERNNTPHNVLGNTKVHCTNIKYKYKIYWKTYKKYTGKHIKNTWKTYKKYIERHILFSIHVHIYYIELIDNY